MTDLFLVLIYARGLSSSAGIIMACLAYRDTRRDQRVARVYLDALSQSITTFAVWREVVRGMSQLLAGVSVLNILLRPLPASAFTTTGWPGVIGTVSITLMSVLMCVESWIDWSARRTAATPIVKP